MEQPVRIKNMGLRGLAVADTKISFIDGEKGILIYRGFRIEDLAKSSNFMETAFLLLMGRLPDKSEAEAFQRQVVQARRVPAFVLETLRLLPSNAHPMDVLQATVPLLAMADPDLRDETRDGNVRKAVRLIARLPVVIAAWDRIRKGKDIFDPNPSLGHAANFLWMLHGENPSASMARALDVCLVLHADHTFNASTFACREVVSTRAHMYAGVAAGVGALSGELHGGANARVMEMLKSLENVDDVAGWVRERLDRKERIMGMGHAVYKTTDPRANILKEISARLGEETGQPQWWRISKTIEEVALEELEKRGKKDIKPNVDFYSASVYHVMGIPADLMTAIFALSRIAGWCAHIIEEKFAEAQEKPMLYRPAAEYVGDYCGLVGCTYVPPEEREQAAGVPSA